MKTELNIFITITIAILFSSLSLKAQSGSDTLIFKAMNDELNRNLSKLSIDKNKSPFFISYQLSDTRALSIRATLGALTYSNELPGRNLYVRLMVGDYSLNDENFVGASGILSGGSTLPLPLDNNYDAIRRAFWISSDQSYKRAVENYSQKLTAIKQQNKSDEERPDDYSKIKPVNFIKPNVPVKYDKAGWEAVAKNISGIFKSFPRITSSFVYINLMNTYVYVTSSEGTRIKFPINLACLGVSAGCQADDGEPLTDQLLYYALLPEDLPKPDKIKQEIQQMADNMATLSKAPAIKDSYSGPVIFEGEAVAELCTQKLLKNNNFIASREPFFATERPAIGRVNKLDDKINQKICSENITIRETPRLKTFNNVPLIGTYEIDFEGVIPKDELTLVDKGILKTLLNDRVPTDKIKESNGHRRFATLGSFVTEIKAPGVINISWDKGESDKVIYRTVLKEAEKNGLEYVYVIRKLEVFNPGQTRSMMSMMSGMGSATSKPIGVYRIDVKTGKEQMVRSAVVSEFQMNNFKDIILGSSEQTVYNTLLNAVVPISVIAPRILVFKDVSIEKNKNSKPKLPVVPNPLLTLKQ